MKPNLKNKESKCKVCGESFSLERGGNGGWKTTKTCSPECRKSLYRENAKHSMHRKDAKGKSWASRKGMNLHVHMMTAEARAKSADASRERGIKRRGTPHTGEAKLNTTRKSRLIVFTSPWGTRHEATGALKFVRENPGLFSDEEIELVSRSDKAKSLSRGNLTCKAMRGLSGIVCGSRNSWKDWTCAVYEETIKGSTS
jgi:hypothetical protein